MNHRLVAAIACRNRGSRLYGKPLQNLDVERDVTILDNIIACLRTVDVIDEIVLGVSEGLENEIFLRIAESKNIRCVIGDERDVLSRLIHCGQLAGATDVFRVTSESPFPYFEGVEALWKTHLDRKADATFLDGVVDGCGFEIISLDALKTSHAHGEEKHRSELCTLYIRENSSDFHIIRATPPPELVRTDLRLTVDNPEDLVVCRAVYSALRNLAPCIPPAKIVKFLDSQPLLIDLIRPFTEAGYANMYVWKKS